MGQIRNRVVLLTHLYDELSVYSVDPESVEGVYGPGPPGGPTTETRFDL